jgi:deoxyhypusine synthase
MNKILQYLGFALEIAEVIPSLVALVQSGDLSATGLQSVINPLIAQLQVTFNVKVPAALADDIIAAVVDAIVAFGKKV